MQLTTSAFKKAAKRYATRHTIPLNEGQQAFSEILGFKSTHDALLRLEKTAGPPVPKLMEVAPRESGWQSSDIFWSGLTLPQSHLLFETLMARPETWGKSRGQDRSAAKGLFRVALAVLEMTHKGPIEASDVLPAAELQVILATETQRREAHFHAGTTPNQRDYVLDGYVQHLVGYDAHKKRTADHDFELPEISEVNVAQHVHATNQLREFVAILKSIEDSGGAGMSVRKVFWCDLTIAQFKILVECLVIQQNDAQDRGRLLLRAVLSTMTVESITQINTAQLFDWVQLDNLDQAFIRTHDRNTVDGVTKPQAEWAAAERPLIRYLLSLPGYDIKKIGKKGGQGDDTRLQHANVLGTMSRVFDLLTAIEATGGASACEVKRPSVDETNIREAINKLIATREHPGTSLQARAILHAAEVAELYPMDQIPARLAA